MNIYTGYLWKGERLAYTVRDIVASSEQDAARRSITALRSSWVSSGASRRQVRATRVLWPI